MHHIICLVFILLVVTISDGLLVKSPEEKDFEVIPNPHDLHNNNAACFTNMDVFLEPYHLLTAPLKTQPDTFQELTYAKVMSVPVPVYHMKQPTRISSAELEFQMVLVKDLTVTGQKNIQTITVKVEKAQDSWFPGYYWSPIVMLCQDTNQQFQHVGWKFSALDSENKLPYFYTLMINMNDCQEDGNKVWIGGFRTPGWMAARILK